MVARSFAGTGQTNVGASKVVVPVLERSPNGDRPVEWKDVASDSITVFSS